MEWQPIETAPKDGFSVLISFDGIVGEAHYYDQDNEHEGWYWAQEHWTDAHVSGPVYPTHWMPLPAPPEVTR